MYVKKGDSTFIYRFVPSCILSAPQSQKSILCYLNGTVTGLFFYLIKHPNVLFNKFKLYFASAFTELYLNTMHVQISTHLFNFIYYTVNCLSNIIIFIFVKCLLNVTHSGKKQIK